MTTGQKWGFGIGIGSLVIAIGVVSYLLYKEKKQGCSCGGNLTPTDTTTVTTSAAARMAYSQLVNQTIPMPSNGKCPDGYIVGANGTYCKRLTTKDLGGGLG